MGKKNQTAAPEDLKLEDAVPVPTEEADAPEATETPAEQAAEIVAEALGDDSSADSSETLSEHPEDEKDDSDDSESAGATPATESTAPAVPTETEIKASVALTPEEINHRAHFPIYPELVPDFPSVDELFPSYTESMKARLGTNIAVKALINFKGCITLHHNFSMVKDQKALVPRWFYMQYSKQLQLIEG